MVEGVSYEEAYRACLLSFCEVLNDNKFSPYDIHTSGVVHSLLQSIDLVSFNLNRFYLSVSDYSKTGSESAVY